MSFDGDGFFSLEVEAFRRDVRENEPFKAWFDYALDLNRLGFGMLRGVKTSRDDNRLITLNALFVRVHHSFQSALNGSLSYGLGVSANSLDFIAPASSGMNFYPGGSSTSAVTISSNTGVGIGTTSPVYLLDIRDSSGANQLHLAGDGSDDGGYILGYSTNGLFLAGGAEFSGASWVAKATSASLLSVNAGGFTFYANTGLTPGNTFAVTPVVTILSSGNVGIGATNPASNLQIGTLTSTSTASPVTLSLGGTYSSTAGANPKLKLWDNGTAYFGAGVSNDELDLIAGIATGQMAFFVNANTSPSMLINSSGQVGIGSTSPQATLDVNGYARLKLQSSQPVACSSTNQGALALNHLAQACACNGTSWIFADSVGAACSW